MIGLVGGIQGTMPLGTLLQKRGRILGGTMRSRSASENRALAEGFMRELSPLFDDKTLTPVIEHVIPMSETARAHALLESNEHEQAGERSSTRATRRSFIHAARGR